MTAHLSDTIWKWGEEVNYFIIGEIAEAIRENMEFNKAEHPEKPPLYTPDAYSVLSDIDAVVYNIGMFLDAHGHEEIISMTDIDKFIRNTPDRKTAKIMVHGVINHLGYEFKP